MATGREKLERQFDRLERLFYKKRATTAQHSFVFGDSPVTPTPFSAPDGFIPTFPQPTFIRPTSSRMVAREEVAWTPRSMRRARSLPESPYTPHLTSPPTPTSGGQPVTLADMTDQCPNIPLRLTSLGPNISPPPSLVGLGPDKPDPLPGLQEFGFPTTPPESEADSSSSRLPWFEPKSSPHHTSLSAWPKTHPNQKHLGTNARDDASVSHPHRHAGIFQQSAREDDPYHRVPQLSPRLVPLPEPSSDELDNGPTVTPQGTRNLRSIKAPSESTKTATRKPTSPSTISTTKRLSDIDPSLHEPSLGDFLTLSDDDIADGNAAPRVRPGASRPPTFGLPPNPPTATTPPRNSHGGYPLLTLCPPLASRPATAAAFEAARIATKYKFDLVYVVNLWPSHMSRSNRLPTFTQLPGTPAATSPARFAAPSPPSSPVSDASRHDSSFETQTPAPLRSAITGRLLAAYGLTTVMGPFRISAPVHQKVLRTDGWLEHRNSGGGFPDEFARGYSCSFYTGHSPARSSGEAGPAISPDGSQHRGMTGTPNRGVVFAAFRLPREDGSVLCSGATELAALHKDAEALVDMVIDFHMNQRKNRTRAPRRCVAGGDGRLGAAKAPLVAV
ncbi:hypothetical protein BT67DRAFT_86960 [Trichocladium antarcticum]|uniref:Uncharacterized protein n=1 Tax=Trichocladium antarcticum TaxID=1450529 RepID=A0AAN6UGJ5_9PEZI|nr:hypothetical protein BT67DRAFT_86960 [Trichocladium antarcticum]